MLEPLVWYESVATSDAFTNIAGEDNFNVNVDGDEIEFPERGNSIALAYAASDLGGAGSIEEARLDVPSLREPADFYIGQVSGDVQPGTSTFNVQDLRNQDLIPGDFERMRVEVRGADGGVAEEYIVVLFISHDSPRSIPAGDFRRIYFTTPAPGTAAEWNRLTMTLDQTLQNGQYEVIGASVRHPDAVVFGLGFENQNATPGGFVSPDEHAEVWREQVAGGMGTGWGQFRDENPPDLYLWSPTAATAVEGHIDIVGPV